MISSLLEDATKQMCCCSSFFRYLDCLSGVNFAVLVLRSSSQQSSKLIAGSAGDAA